MDFAFIKKYSIFICYSEGVRCMSVYQAAFHIHIFQAQNFSYSDNRAFQCRCMAGLIRNCRIYCQHRHGRFNIPGEILMQVERDTVVTVKYTLKVKDGETPAELDRPYTARFLYGRDRVLPVLEQALSGRQQGEKLDLTIPASQAFGYYDEKLVKPIPLDAIKHPELLKEGEVYEDVRHNGEGMRFMVRRVHDKYVEADFNHPAAGKDLMLQARIAEVKAASPMEILASINAASGGG